MLCKSQKPEWCGYSSCSKNATINIKNKYFLFVFVLLKNGKLSVSGEYSSTRLGTQITKYSVGTSLLSCGHLISV